MAKQILRIEIDTSFSLYGISCHLKDFRFAWTINNELNINFIKTKPYIKNKKQEFSKYEYELQEDKIFCFANKSKDGFLIPKRKQVDYWVLFQNTIDKKRIKNIIKSIHKNQHVLAIFEENKIEIKENFVF